MARQNRKTFEKATLYTSNIIPAANVTINYIYRSVTRNTVTFSGRFRVAGGTENKAAALIILSGFNIPYSSISGVVVFTAMDNNNVTHDETALYNFFLKENGEVKNATLIITDVDLRFTVIYILPNG